MTNKKPDLAILIPAHDSYKDIVYIWCQAIKKFWPDCPYPIIWANGTETLEDEKVTVLHCGNDSAFCGRILHALETVDAKYLLIWGEDFIMTRNFDGDRLRKIVDYMQLSESVHCRMFHSGKADMLKSPLKDLYKIEPTKAYAISINVGIFTEDFLRSALRETWSGWDMEKHFLSLSQEGKSFGCLYDDSNNGNMVHLVKQGMMFPEAYRAVKKAGFKYAGNREIMPCTQSLMFNLTTFIGGICPQKMRAWLKVIAKKMGAKFVTEN